MVFLNSSSAKGGRTQSALESIFILFWVQVCHTIKRDASLGGLRKIECSSIKIKSKERHKITSQTLRYSLWTFSSQKSQREPGVPTVRSPDIWCWKSQRLLTQPLVHLRISFIESPDGSHEFWVPEVLAPIGSSDALGLSPLARLSIGSLNKSQKSWLLEVPALHQEFRLQLC